MPERIKVVTPVKIYRNDFDEYGHPKNSEFVWKRYPGWSGFVPRTFTELNGSVYFSAQRFITADSLEIGMYTSDGTIEGTHLIKKTGNFNTS